MDAALNFLQWAGVYSKTLGLEGKKILDNTEPRLSWIRTRKGYYAVHLFEPFTFFLRLQAGPGNLLQCVCNSSVLLARALLALCCFCCELDSEMINVVHVWAIIRIVSGS